MGRYFDPTNDVAFKRLFGTEEHKSLLISFLNAILGLTGSRKIKAVELLSQEQVPAIKEIKASILDIKCTDERNVQYIVEMQNRKVPGFVKRTQFYAANSYASQLTKGSTHLELKPVVLLAILNHELFPKKENVVSYHKTLDTDTLENDLEDIAYVFIELPKFNKSEDELETLQDKWIYFFKEWNVSKAIPKAITEKELIEAYNVIEEFNWSPAEREAYLKAHIARDEVFAEKEDAFQKGEKKGIEETKEQIARSLIIMEIADDKIMRVTGLSQKAIDKIKNSDSLKKMLKKLKLS